MIEYFEARARNYRERSERGLWSQFRRFEFDAVCELLGPKRGGQLLELGCGAGFYSLYLREKFAMQILAVDSSPAMLAELSGCDGIETWLGEADSFPMDRRFDYVLAAGLFEFVKSPRPVLERAARVLPPGGKLVLLVPVAGWRGALYARAHDCPVFIREANEYIRLGTSCGFELHRSLPSTPISLAMEFRRAPMPL